MTNKNNAFVAYTSNKALSKSQIDNIFAQASLPKESWDLVVKIIEVFEAGKRSKVNHNQDVIKA